MSRVQRERHDASGWIQALAAGGRDLAKETWGSAVLSVYGATEANVIGVE